MVSFCSAQNNPLLNCSMKERNCVHSLHSIKQELMGECTLQRCVWENPFHPLNVHSVLPFRPNHQIRLPRLLYRLLSFLGVSIRGSEAQMPDLKLHKGMLATTVSLNIPISWRRRQQHQQHLQVNWKQHPQHTKVPQIRVDHKPG